MKTTLLDYYKMILQKVSFDYTILMKEYAKALRTLNEKEARLLEKWFNDQKLSY